MKKLNSNFIPVSKSLANAAASGALEQLAATAGASLSGGGGGTSYDQAATSDGVIGLPVGNTNARANIEGGFRINSDTNYLEVYYANNWLKVSYLGVMSGTGGTVSTVGNYKIHTFTSPGTFTASETGDIDLLLVAGGGGGGFDVGGGGGGGGIIYQTNQRISIGSYPITIGAGGAGSNVPGAISAPSGSPSTGFGYTAVGGGGGGNYPGGPAATGGSGGGGVGYGTGTVGAAGTPGQGNPGGSAITPYGNAATGGGGGGYSTAGADSTNSGSSYAAGGAGLTTDISGISVEYGFGGKGAGDLWTGMQNAAANTGGGGDGGGNPNTGKNGGSGIAIIRYRYQ